MLKIKDKNAITLEHVFKVMNGAVEEFDGVEVTIAWACLSRTLRDIYKLVEETLDGIDAWRRGDIVQHKDFEREVASVYASKKRWGGNVSKCGEMIVILTRWIGREEMMRIWMKRNLGKREMKSVDTWMDDYQAGRLRVLPSFTKAE